VVFVYRFSRWADAGRLSDQTVGTITSWTPPAATKTANQQVAAGFDGTGTPSYTDAWQIVRATVLPTGAARLARTGGLRPWEVVTAAHAANLTTRTVTSMATATRATRTTDQGLSRGRSCSPTLLDPRPCVPDARLLPG
jgi:hypothetical protein